jgi:peptidoglycan/xylan/chitin deacetylase (PgdA/CDA1 family)
VASALWNRISPTIDQAGNLLLSPPFGGRGQFVNHGSRHQKKIALTFDDGPSKGATEQLLDAMDGLGVKGTFFCVGVNAQLNPDLLRRLYSEGHIVGNHSWAHHRGGSLKLKDDGHIEHSAHQIAEIIGTEPRLYRPPWGWLTPWEGFRLHKRGYTIVGWDVYTLDWRIPEPAAEAVAAGVLRDTKPGSILLFHDAYVAKEYWEKQVTVESIKRIVPALQAQGYEFVTIPQLLNVPAYASAEQASERLITSN